MKKTTHSTLNRYRCMGAVFSLSLALSGASSLAFADDAQVIAGLEKAQALFDQRSAEDPQPIEDAIATLAALEGQADDSDLNYDVLILESRAYYWKGERQTTRNDRMAVHQLGRNKADAAAEINDGYADAYYFGCINLARWAEANGVLESMNQKDALLGYLDKIMERNARNGLPGENIDGDGPNRMSGRIYFKLPGILGGSRAKSLQYLEKAIKNSEENNYKVPLNHVYYAETLSTGNGAERARAKQVLTEILQINPEIYNPKRIPESRQELEQARILLSKI